LLTLLFYKILEEQAFGKVVSVKKTLEFSVNGMDKSRRK